MSKRLYPHAYIKYWYVYDIGDICNVYHDLGLHPQTVRAWVKDGLKTIDSGKPTLIYGYDLSNYIKTQNDKNKCKTAFDEMFCMKCHDARGVLKNHVTIQHKQGFFCLSGVCRTCKTAMFKSYKLDDLPNIKRTFYVVDVLELYDCEVSACKTHMPDPNVTSINESGYGTPYGDLFG